MYQNILTLLLIACVPLGQIKGAENDDSLNEWVGISSDGFVICFINYDKMGNGIFLVKGTKKDSIAKYDISNFIINGSGVSFEIKGDPAEVGFTRWVGKCAGNFIKGIDMLDVSWIPHEGDTRDRLLFYRSYKIEKLLWYKEKLKKESNQSLKGRM